MTLDLQLKINSDEKLKSFLRENSYWYKYLNRNPNIFPEFVEDMKKTYKLTPGDRMNKLFDNLSMFQTFLEMLR